MRPLLKHQAAVMRELCAQTAVLREIRDALHGKTDVVISEAFGVREPQTIAAHWHNKYAKPSCWQRIKRWMRGKPTIR